MSPAMSWAEHLVMAGTISVSVAVMIALVFLADHQSRSGRPHIGEQRGGKQGRSAEAIAAAVLHAAITAAARHLHRFRVAWSRPGAHRRAGRVPPGAKQRD